MAPWNGLALTAILALGATCGVSWGIVSAAEPEAGGSVATAESRVAHLVQQLGDAGYADRQAASQALSQAGLNSIQPLAAAAAGEHVEMAWRARTLLEQIAANGNEPTLGRIADSLRPYAEPKRPELAQLLDHVESRRQQLRRDRAVATLRALGAVTPPAAPGDGTETVKLTVNSSIATVKTEAKAELAPLSPSEVAPVSASGDNLKLVDPQAKTPAVDPRQPVITDLRPSAGLPEPAPPPEAEVQELDGADEPAPPPDFLPETPVGEMPPLQGEIADAYVSEELTIETGGAGPVHPGTAQVVDPVTSLSLSAAWRGGDAGLSHLRDLPELERLTIADADLTDAALKLIAELPNLTFFKVQGTSITADGLRKLHAERPSLLITASGEAMLGLSARSDGDRCQIVSVNPQSGAAQAGLQTGDFITQIGDARVTSLIDLMIEVFPRKAGEKLRVQYERRGEPKMAIVELQARSAPPSAAR